MLIRQVLKILVLSTSVLGGSIVLKGSDSGITIKPGDGTTTKLNKQNLKGLATHPMNGWEIRDQPSGVYSIQTSAGVVEAYVDNDYQLGGWTLVAKMGGCMKDENEFYSQHGAFSRPGRPETLITPPTEENRDYMTTLKFGRRQFNALFEQSEFKQMRYDFTWTTSWRDPWTGTTRNHHHGWTMASYGANRKKYFCQKTDNFGNFDAWHSLFDAFEWSNGGSLPYIGGPGKAYQVWSGDLPASTTSLTSSSPIPHHYGGAWHHTAATSDSGKLGATEMLTTHHGGQCWGDIERGAQWMLTTDPRYYKTYACELQHTYIYVR